MKRDPRWSVRVEQQPHRDAVRRLRKAYEQLWQMQQTAWVTGESERGAKKAPHSVQEVET
jgi:hypothetical protein